MRKYVVYTRVSTQEQGRSGLGLEAQQRDIEIFLTSYSDVPWEIVGAFLETESGADDDRPELTKALALARKTGAELLVAKLDRLSRKVSFLARLLDDRSLRVRVASMPHADKFQLHIYAALAEQERDFISTRTKAALAAAKARGVKLGGDRVGALDKANAAKAVVAGEFAARINELVGPMRETMSLAAIAAALTRQGLTAPAGGKWTAKAVSRVLERAAA